MNDTDPFAAWEEEEAIRRLAEYHRTSAAFAAKSAAEAARTAAAVERDIAAGLRHPDGTPIEDIDTDDTDD